MADKATLSDIASATTSGADHALIQVTKRRGRLHHAPGDSRRPRPAARLSPPTRTRAPLFSHNGARDGADPLQTPWVSRLSEPRRSRPGRGPAEGQGRAIRCSPPAPPLPSSTLFSAAIRPPPGRCAPAWRFRAPPRPPRSSGSTPTTGRCAICASPSATPSALWRGCSRFWRDARQPAAQP